STASARCKAVVHEVVASAYSAPESSRNRPSNSATFGPCTIQPVSSGATIASASSLPKNGRVIPMFILVSIDPSIAASPGSGRQQVRDRLNVDVVQTRLGTERA